MQPVQLAPDLQLSPIVAGLWRLVDWQMSPEGLQQYIEACMILGITTFDNADIYGDYGCEAVWGQVMRDQPRLREQMQLVTKCGIMLLSDKFPQRKVKHYDSSYAHIIHSAEQSLLKLQTEYIDLLLIHRPDPLMDPEETARAFEELRQSGKVRHFGVSNFTPMQYQMLNSYVGCSLVTNQVEFSPFALGHLDNGNLDFFLKEQIKPMAWSPLGGGMLMAPKEEQGLRLKQKLEEIAEELGVDGADKVAYAWILKHPSRPLPIVGSGKIERVQRAVESLSIDLSREQWFRILEASRGHEVA